MFVVFFGRGYSTFVFFFRIFFVLEMGISTGSPGRNFRICHKNKCFFSSRNDKGMQESALERFLVTGIFFGNNCFILLLSSGGPLTVD